MEKLMCWSNGSLMILDGGIWMSYKNHPLKVNRPQFPTESPGYPTMQHLLGLGYKLVNADVMSKVNSNV